MKKCILCGADAIDEDKEECPMCKAEAIFLADDDEDEGGLLVE